MKVAKYCGKSERSFVRTALTQPYATWRRVRTIRSCFSALHIPLKEPLMLENVSYQEKMLDLCMFAGSKIAMLPRRA